MSFFNFEVSTCSVCKKTEYSTRNENFGTNNRVRRSCLHSHSAFQWSDFQVNYFLSSLCFFNYFLITIGLRNIFDDCDWKIKKLDSITNR
jgi:hypothetical protein